MEACMVFVMDCAGALTARIEARSDAQATTVQGLQRHAKQVGRTQGEMTPAPWATPPSRNPRSTSWFTLEVEF
jgi:hypothetical protein